MSVAPVSQNIEFHPLANIFPMLDGEAFAEIVEDVRCYGVREPITLLDGKILDGRNRYRAAIEADVHPPMVAYGNWSSYRIEHRDSLDDDRVRPYAIVDIGDGYEVFAEYLGELADPLAFVVSLNLKRRHLNESQRAMVAAKLANLKPGRPAETSPMGDIFESAPANPRVSQSDAASILNVGKRSVERAVSVVDRGVPELVDAVERGEIAVRPAAEIAKQPAEQQRESIAKHVRGTFGTGENEWYTPDQHLELARQVLGAFDLDPASSEIANNRVGASQFFTIDDDGLTREWSGRVWMNPPYAQPAIAQFAEKLASEWEAGRIEAAIALTHNYTDTAWFQRMARAATAICFTRGRVRFVSPTGDLAAPTQGQAFFYFGPDADIFSDVFGQIGFVARVD